ncbi:MAG: DUF401 family protein [Bacillota bacterium]
MISIIGVLLAFFLVVYLLSQKKLLAVAMSAGSIVVGLTKDYNIIKNLGDFFPTMYQGIIDPVAIELIILVALVSVFAYLMKETGLLDELIFVIKYYISNLYITMSIIPSIIGMLPIPGGAIFSAPIIYPIGKKMKMSGAKMTSINIYYRHLWYFSFPFLPSLIIASSLSGLEIYSIAIMHLPIVVIMILIGWFYYKGNDSSNENISEDKFQKTMVNKEVKTKITWKQLLKTILPFVIVIVLPIISPIEFIVSLMLGILFVIIIKRDQVNLKMVADGFDTKLTLGVAAIMIFRAFIERSDGVYNITNIFIEAGIPLLILAIIIPFIVGILTGNQTGAIGIVYPILLILFAESNYYSLWHMIIYSSSYFGYILSPFHLCNLLTIEYFDTTLSKYYKEIMAPFVFTAIGVIFLSIIYYKIL